MFPMFKDRKDKLAKAEGNNIKVTDLKKNQTELLI